MWQSEFQTMQFRNLYLSPLPSSVVLILATAQALAAFLFPLELETFGQKIYQLVKIALLFARNQKVVNISKQDTTKACPQCCSV